MSLQGGLRRAAARTVQLSRPAVRNVPKRNMSADADPKELESQQVKWTQISKAAVALVAVCTIYSFATVEHAPPPHHVYSYMHQRKKKFPWGDGNTPIFGETPIDVIARGGEVEHHH